MRLFISGLTLFVALCLIAPAGDAFAPRPPLYTGAAVAFDDADGDRITSDGAAYVDGGNAGLEVRVWINGSQDVTIGTFRSGRRINFSYTPANDVGPQPTLNPPSGSLQDNAFVNIQNIGAMVVGTPQIKRASFNTAIGYFRWLAGPNHVSYGSHAVLVTRLDRTTWKVRTPESGTWDGYPVGDLSVLLKEAKGKLTAVGLYHMPFGLTVTCDACPAP